MQVHTHQLRSLKNQRDQIVDSRNEAMRNAMIGATRRTSPEDVIARRNEEAQREREGKEYAMLERACVCVNLGTGQRRPFPILELTKARWTCPPPLAA